MRRLGLGLLAVVALLAGAFLVFFTASPFRVAGQPYLTSLGDFLFALDSFRRQTFSLPVPPLDDAGYEALMRRLRRHTHREVEGRVIWQLEQWGAEAVPRLAAELTLATDRPRIEGAVRALGEIGGAAASEALAGLLCGLPEQLEGPQRRLVWRTNEALGQSGGPAAATALEECAGPRVARGQLTHSEYLEALARTGHAAETLLAELRATRDPGALHEMLWALALTRDADVAQVLVPLLLHPLADVRQRARDAIDQSMGPVAIGPALDLLEEERDGYVMAALVGFVLDGDARGHPRVVPALAALLDHPALGGQAVFALARLGGPDAVSILRDHVREHPQARKDLNLLGAAALPIVADLLASDDAGDRRDGIAAAVAAYTPAARPLVEPLAHDPDLRVAREAREALLALDGIALHASWAASFPPRLGAQLWGAFRPDIFGNSDRGVEHMWPVLAFLHWAGVAFSALLAVLLVLKALRLFEPYRFELFLVFLLCWGVVGDFFFAAGGAAPWWRYQAATSLHLLLLVGFVCLGRDRVPGELRGRFEALGGASVWILAPGLLFFAAPVFAEALRRSLSDWGHLRSWLWLLAVSTLLVLEQWLVPWHAFPRRALVERTVRAGLSAWLLGLLGASLLALAELRRAQGDPDGASVATLLTLPLGFMLVVHLHSLGVLRSRGRAPSVAPPPGRLRVLEDGESLRVRLAAPRPTRLGRALRLALVLGPALGAAVAAGPGRASGMVLAVVSAPLGAALGALCVLLLESPFVVEIRRGWVRSARTWLGAALGTPSGGSGWRRRLPSRGLDAPTRGPGWRLTDEEDAWLQDVAAGGSGEIEPGGPASLHLELRAPSTDPGSPFVSAALEVTNRGARPLSPAELDDAAGGISWRGRADGIPVGLYFTRADRERRIAPGASVVLRPRFDLGRPPRGPVRLVVSQRGATSNEVTLTPAGGAS